MFSTAMCVFNSYISSVRQILDPSKLKEFAYDNFGFDGNGGEFFSRVENNVGDREIAHYGAITPFPTVFSKDLYCRHIKTWAC